MTKLRDIDDMKDFPIKPVGWYHVEIEKAPRKPATTDGKPLVNVWLKIVVGEYEGSYLFHNASLNARAIGFMKPFLLALDYPEDFDLQTNDEDVLVIDEKDWIGKQLMVYVGHDTYNGKPKEKIECFKSLKTEGTKPIETKSESQGGDEEIPF